MTALLKYLLDPQFVVMALQEPAFATVVSFVLPLLSGDRLGSRMKYVASERERLRAETMTRLAERAIPRNTKDRAKDIHAESRQAAQPAKALAIISGS